MRIDDLFMFHDYLFPYYLGITQGYFYAWYAIFVSIYLILFRIQIQKYDYPILVLAFVFFALSIGSDILLPQEGLEYLFEDAFKFFGIVSWFIYFARACFSSNDPI